MELIKKVMPTDYNLYHVTDLHIGPACCYINGIRKVVRKIENDPIGYMVMTGDAIDSILPNDKRYAHMSMDKRFMTPQQQWKEAARLFKPIKEKILLWMLGNHEFTVINTVDVCQDICERLDVPYGGVMSKFIALDENEKVMHKFLFWHGSGCIPKGAKDPIQKKANRLAALKAKLVNTEHTDCIYMGCGHFHPSQFLIQPPTVDDEVMLTDKNGKIVQEQRYTTRQNIKYIPPECRWYGCSPGFLMAYGEPNSGVISYAEIAGYGPTRLGWLELKIRAGLLVDVISVDAL